MHRAASFAVTAAAAVLLAAAPAAAQDIAAGEKAFNKCKACHTLEKGGAHRVGPNLHGMFGRTAGAVEGFKFSDAMKNSGVVWTPETVDQYITRPREFIKGNRMAFAGINNAEERANLIAYLQQATK